MAKKEYKYSEITEKIIGCALKVDQRMRSGYPDDIEVGKRRVDFLIENRVIEIKAVSQPRDSPLAQALNYLAAFILEIGLLISFGSKSLEVKRLIK